MKSLAMIVPINILEHANILGESLGYGPESFTIPCGDGNTITHYAGYLANADNFLSILGQAMQGIVPPTVTQEQVDTILNLLIFDAAITEDSVAHLDNLLTTNNLIRM